LLSTVLALSLFGIPDIARAQDLHLVWAASSNQDALYDPRITQSRHEMQVIWQVFDQLVAADSEGNLFPGLATSWEVAEDNMSVRFMLREGVTFHDGTPFDAEAVKFTLDTIADPATGSQAAVDYLGPYAGSEVIGPHEIVVTFSRPYPNMISAFSEAYLSPVSPTAVQEKGNTGFAQSPVGTGPFRFVEWVQGSHVELERFEDYDWAPEFFDHSGPSMVSRITHRAIPNAATGIAALETGEVHLVDQSPPLDVSRMADEPGFGLFAGTVSGVPYSVMLNTSQPPLDDIRVRKAIFHAVDRPRLTQNLFFGYSTAAFGPLSSSTPGYWPGVEDYYPYDPDGAAALLEEAGWTMGSDGIRQKDGEPLAVHMLAMLAPETAVALQAEARKVGIHLNVENVTKARQDELVMNNQFMAGEIRWVSNTPSVLRIPFHSSNIPEPGAFRFNWMHLASAELDAMIEEAASADTLEVELAKYADIQRYIMDEAVFMAVHDQTQNILHTDEITGLVFAPGQWQVHLYAVRPATN
jgi:peptide/nickel transport system substrate-binding protein